MVKWKGYDTSENTEIPYENFNSKSMITRYYKKLNQTNPHAVNEHASPVATKNDDTATLQNVATQKERLTRTTGANL
ncbi:MAG: hypothetical protein BYD32DRAFT_412676 [Podila humilis]|nr:MAG: hypothetical protein BYD32DRAFT_412676 [Podila humilis]